MTSMWAYTMTHEAFLHRYTGINRKGDAQYDPPLDGVPVRFMCHMHAERKEVLDKDGNKVISEASLIAETELHPLDVVLCKGQRWTVISCRDCEDAFGNHDHWKARL